MARVERLCKSAVAKNVTCRRAACGAFLQLNNASKYYTTLIGYFAPGWRVQGKLLERISAFAGAARIPNPVTNSIGSCTLFMDSAPLVAPEIEFFCTLPPREKCSSLQFSSWY